MFLSNLPLKQTNIAVAILHNQPILRLISCESCKTQLLVKKLRRLDVFYRQANREISPFPDFLSQVVFLTHTDRFEREAASTARPTAPSSPNHASTVAGLPPVCGFIFFLRINAETKVIINPTGNGSAKVIAALMKGLSKYFN